MVQALLQTMRPKQWAKNIFIFGALVFDKKLFEPAFFLRTLAAFVMFCLLSSTVYIINDLGDIEKDRQHPIKRHRPLASGRLMPSVALGAAIGFLVVLFPLAFFLDEWFGVIALAYLVNNLLYTYWLKNVVIVDVLSIAAGFVMRVGAGAAVIPTQRFSPWIYVCMTLLALFLGFGKRRHELALLASDANNHRRVLDDYSLRFLDEMMGVVTASTVMAYAIYTFSAEGLPPNHSMMLTVPFVLYAVFRYLYLIHVRGEGGAPEEILLGDLPFLVDVTLWGILVIVLIYLAPA
ncbi:MAG: decaprenyl-phosphate phosphoribosyltransferase [Anaerolineae bacterium]|nr:MAG: decaprenyl-phosphate phosphoribosyltransferase [Anaerolineae bacterium]